MDYCYTNLNEDAAWRSTLWSSLPWSETPELASCRGFDIKMIAADLLHVWHLGTARDLLGSCMKLLVKLRYFPGATIEKSLARASVRVKNFAKANKLSLALGRFTKQNLTWTTGAYPEVKCKGYDSYIILAWLADEFAKDPPSSADAALQTVLDEMCTCVWAADSWMRMLTHAGMFLSESQQLQKTVVGSLFMTMYLSLAQRAVVEGSLMWRVRPKIHSLHHSILEDRPSRLNPHFAATWLDEDFIKRVMRVKKQTHKRVASEKSLRRWLLGIVTKLDDVMLHLEG